MNNGTINNFLLNFLDKILIFKKTIMSNIDKRLATELKLLNILEEESLKMLLKLQNNNQIDKVQFERCREIVKRIYYN